MIYKDSHDWRTGTFSATMSKDENLLIGIGSDFDVMTGWTATNAPGYTTPVPVSMYSTLFLIRNASNFRGLILNDTTPGNNQKVRMKLPISGSSGTSQSVVCRSDTSGNFYRAVRNNNQLVLTKFVTWTTITTLGTVNHVIASGIVEIEIEANGTTITARDITNGDSVSAVDATHSSGKIGTWIVADGGSSYLSDAIDYIHCYDGTNTGLWTSPVIDSGVSAQKWLLSWLESLGASCDITIDFDANDNPANLFTGSEETGLTDPNGYISAREGRYAQVKAHLTRTSTDEAVLKALSVIATSIEAADYPSEDDVRDGVTFDFGDKEGNMTLPPITSVKDGSQYGTNGTEYTGILDVEGMIVTHSRLAEIGFVPASVSSIYANPNNTKSYVKRIQIHNLDTSQRRVKVWLVPDNAGAIGTAGDVNQAYDLDIPAKESVHIEYNDEPLIMTDENDSIQMWADAASKCTVLVDGATQ